MVNFFTFKWGSKYGPEYVNRQYGMLQRYVDHDFTHTCITDDANGIRDEVNIIDYNTFDPFDYPKDRIFTREKLVLFKEFNQGKNIWLDLDLLIHNDITDLIEQKIEKPTFIWNWWNWDLSSDKRSALKFYGQGTMCYVNSSFVMWEDNMGEHIFDAVNQKQEYAFYTYKSLDKYLFYQHWHKGHLDFWDRGLWYNYNFSEPRFTYMPEYRGCIFNTSHIKANNLTGIEAYELDEAEGVVAQLWRSYDDSCN